MRLASSCFGSIPKFNGKCSLVIINDNEKQSIKLNAKFKAQKINQKKLFNEIQECLYISQKVNYEIIKTFQEFYNKLEELRYQNLIEQYENEFEM